MASRPGGLQGHAFTKPTVLPASGSSAQQPTVCETNDHGSLEAEPANELEQDVAPDMVASITIPHLELPTAHAEEILRQDGSVRKITVAQLHTRLKKVRMMVFNTPSLLLSPEHA